MEQKKESWNEGGKSTKKMKTCLGELKRDKNPKSCTKLWQ